MWRYAVTTRASRAVSGSPIPPTALAFGIVLLLLALGASAQQTPAEPDETSQEIMVPVHWSPYQAPTSYPEGTELHIIVDGDTLWDLASQYFENPFLWPQLWDANRYIENPHLIYPGDPLQIPDLDVIRPEGVAAGDTGPGAGPGGGPGGPGAGPEGGGPGVGPGGAQAPAFYPAYEEQTIACAGYLAPGESSSLRITGSEEGDAKVGLATDDIVYLSRGSDDGINPGDEFYIQRQVDFSYGVDGTHVVRTGSLVVLAVQEDTALAEITQACTDIHVDDYLLPFEPIPVPLLPRQPLATRLTPETGQMRGEIVASLDDLASLGEGYLVSIDLGEEDGVVPGNMFTVFRYVHPDAPRKMLGELAVLTVQEDNATARIMQSYDFMMVGDLIELK